MVVHIVFPESLTVKLHHTIAVVLLLSFSLPVLGQEGFLKKDIQFEHFTEGLSQNTVTSILQDHYGFLWVGTWSGLNRFDGVEFKVYERVQGDPTTLGGNYIFDLYEDSKGVLWIATRNGLSKYNWGTDNFETFRNDPNDPNSLSGNSITKVFEDSRGNFWVGTERNGLNLLTGKQEKLFTIEIILWTQQVSRTILLLPSLKTELPGYGWEPAWEV